MIRRWSAFAGALVVTACGSIHGPHDPASSTTSRSADEHATHESDSTPRPFDADQLAKIFQHSPLLDPPADPTNKHADDPKAAHLGQWLFFDKRFSKDRAHACASCHDPERAFTDGRAVADGLGATDRNTPALWNAAWQRWFFWDGRADSLWAQALQPLENEVEMGGNRSALVHSISGDASLRAAYEAIFGKLPELGDSGRFPPDARPCSHSNEDALARAWSSMQPVDCDVVNRVFANCGKALEAYVRRIRSRNSAFDRYVAALRDDDASAQSQYPDAARRGLALFVGKANCRSCHAGPNFTDGEFHNIGVPSHDTAKSERVAEAPAVAQPIAKTSAPSGGVDAGRRAGIERATRDPFNAAGVYSDDPSGHRAAELGSLVRSSESFGQFKTPSLRNVALTAPYMHQGQIATLRDVLHYYSTLDGSVPAGHHGEQVLRPLHLAPEEIDDIVAFLETLTDAELPRDLTVPPSSPLPSLERAASR